MTIKMEDLLVTCPKCRGKPPSKVQPPAPDGLHDANVIAITHWCDECGQDGFVLTDSGNALLVFMQKVKNIV